MVFYFYPRGEFEIITTPSSPHHHHHAPPYSNPSTPVSVPVNGQDTPPDTAEGANEAPSCFQRNFQRSNRRPLQYVVVLMGLKPLCSLTSSSQLHDIGVDLYYGIHLPAHTYLSSFAVAHVFGGLLLLHLCCRVCGGQGRLSHVHGQGQVSEACIFLCMFMFMVETSLLLYVSSQSALPVSLAHRTLMNESSLIDRTPKPKPQRAMQRSGAQVIHSFTCMTIESVCIGTHRDAQMLQGYCVAPTNWWRD